MKFLSSGLMLNDDTPAVAAIQLIFPSKSGFVTRNDFVKHRLEGCPDIVQVCSFLSPLQYLSPAKRPTDNLEFIGVFSKAIAGIKLSSSSAFSSLTAELHNRLNIPWVVPGLARRRIVWVQGREDIDSIECAFKAAAALGIQLVIFDEPGHWLEPSDSPWAYLREKFVQVDITPDEGLDSRIVDAVKSYPYEVDGIVTISDVRLPAIARACRILGLPTENPEAYDIAGDKGRTRLLENVGRSESFVLEHADELATFLEYHADSLLFPLIVKPVIGWCSDCVSKVRNTDELKAAVYKASNRHARSAKRSTSVVVEPYIDGPEVDANLVLLDGEVLFSDISDDFPSPADQQGAGSEANFQETQNVMPSGLPSNELDAIRDQMRDSILRQGFRSGVFHCEARVRNSRAQYAEINGIVDLVKKGNAEDFDQPQVYLHEINARPPGYLETIAVLMAYGVDYYALRMLLAIGASEQPRLRALSQPFSKGPQFHLSLMIIQQDRSGIMKSADAAKEFLDAHPSFGSHVVDYYTRKKGGDILEGPDATELWWIAYFSVIDRASRRSLLERVEFVQQNFKYEVEE
ncbi:glutathione synthetase ATP-binding domain-like protein [Corynespora cassiicola Philippines]|uniref:Glutathione synthetase ATP-binding domain-like protein n=1 Tax=Corynespora cassiicola Philippines TaxID=1448308 RepID=A0A2T2NMG0_CORCC|nr:glutathione synthetase ATP-binding domain-like protein [Corynespora cassiicola Philippines]